MLTRLNISGVAYCAGESCFLPLDIFHHPNIFHLYFIAVSALSRAGPESTYSCEMKTRPYATFLQIILQIILKHGLMDQYATHLLVLAT